MQIKYLFLSQWSITQILTLSIVSYTPKKCRKADKAACSEKQGGDAPTVLPNVLKDRGGRTHDVTKQTDTHKGGTHPQSYQTSGYTGGTHPNVTRLFLTNKRN